MSKCVPYKRDTLYPPGISWDLVEGVAEGVPPHERPLLRRGDAQRLAEVVPDGAQQTAGLGTRALGHLVGYTTTVVCGYSHTLGSWQKFR